MIRTKKAKITERKTTCYNCGQTIDLTPQAIKRKDFDMGIKVIATYIECPVCGENMLKQLDTEETYNVLNPQRMKLVLKQKNTKLSPKQKDKLSKLNRSIDNTRQKIKPLFWDKVYQLLNPQEDNKTGIADQELTLGKTQEPTPEIVGKGD